MTDKQKLYKALAAALEFAHEPHDRACVLKVMAATCPEECVKGDEHPATCLGEL